MDAVRYHPTDNKLIASLEIQHPPPKASHASTKDNVCHHYYRSLSVHSPGFMGQKLERQCIADATRDLVGCVQQQLLRAFYL